MKRSIAALILVLGACGYSAAAESVRVSRKQLECVRDNAEKYLSVQDDQMTIVLPACPIVDPVEAFRSLAENNAFKRSDDGDEQLDAILTIKKSAFSCVINALKKGNDDPVIVYIDKDC